MTLILKLNLDIVKRYECTKNEASTFNGSKVIAQTDRYTDRQTDTQTDRRTDSSENITYPHTRMVIVCQVKRGKKTTEKLDRAPKSSILVSQNLGTGGGADPLVN